MFSPKNLTQTLFIMFMSALRVPWKTIYSLDTLDHLVPFGYLGPLGTFWIPWTTRYLLDTIRYPLDTFDQ